MLSERQRGPSWVGCSIIGEAGQCAPCIDDAERSDAVDGVRRQLSRARPDLGLCRAQLPQTGGRTVLDRLDVRGGPEPCGLQFGETARDIGPDQAEREKVDDE